MAFGRFGNFDLARSTIKLHVFRSNFVPMKLPSLNDAASSRKPASPDAKHHTRRSLGVTSLEMVLSASSGEVTAMLVASQVSSCSIFESGTGGARFIRWTFAQFMLIQRSNMSEVANLLQSQASVSGAPHT